MSFANSESEPFGSGTPMLVTTIPADPLSASLPALGGGAERQYCFPASPCCSHRRGDLIGDSSSVFYRIAGEVRVARRRSRLAVTEHLADDWQTESARRGDAGEGVP
jgi:hypothetical protein